MKKFILNTATSTTEIFCGNNSFEKIPKLLKYNKGTVFIVVDKNVNKFYQKRIIKVFRQIKSRSFYYILKNGERSKSLSELNRVYSFLKKNNCSKDSFVYSIGGGVTGDVVGFAASTYMRGVNVIHIPTTLLSMVDSSIGGKSAVNFDGIKNLIGTIYQPKNVIIDPVFLKTLPRREILSGVGEIFKYGFLMNQSFFINLTRKIPEILKGENDSLEEIILQCARYKSSVVQLDENDSGTRKILNLGHTFAHAVEGELNHKVSHGECVLFGLLCMLYLSKITGLLSEKRFNQYFNSLPPIKLNKRINTVNENNVLQKMNYDKKKSGTKPTFILIKRIGEIIIDCHAEQKQIITAIKAAKQSLNAKY